MTEALFSNRDFKLHWASVALAQTGNFFTAVALPWLVLSLSNDDAVAVITVAAAISLPNAFFILFGGGLADRFSPFRSLLVSRMAFVVVMASFAGLVLAGAVPLWLIYPYALVLGTLSAVGIPASQSLLPSFVHGAALAKANGVVMGTLQVAQMVGPLAAGWVIWLGKHLSGANEAGADPPGSAFAFAFAVDAVAMLAAVAIMSGMKVSPTAARAGKVLTLIREGMVFCWRDTGIRLVLGYLLLVSFFLQGPLLSVLPLFTKLNLGLDERAYGSLYGMIGAGTILGAAIAVLTRPRAKILGHVVLGCDFVVGAGFFSLGQVRDPWIAGALLLTMGGGLGLVAVAGTTWFQHRTPAAYMGRVMSLVMFAIYGLMPASATLAAGIVDATSVSTMMSGAAVVIMVFTGIGLMLPNVRGMGDRPTPGTSGAREADRSQPLVAAGNPAHE